jgi:hypothetical protein
MLSIIACTQKSDCERIGKSHKTFDNKKIFLLTQSKIIRMIWILINKSGFISFVDVTVKLSFIFGRCLHLAKNIFQNLVAFQLSAGPRRSYAFFFGTL